MGGRYFQTEVRGNIAWKVFTVDDTASLNAGDLDRSCFRARGGYMEGKRDQDRADAVFNIL